MRNWGCNRLPLDFARPTSYVGKMGRANIRFEGLDALRGFAAASILIYHAIILRKLIEPEATPAFVKLLYTGVPLFFSISAFSLCAGYYGRLGNANQIVSFYVRRFARIAPLYYLMVLAWVLILSYLWQSWRLPELSDVLLNLTFLYNFVPQSATSLVPAGWSLGVEFIFYAAFPILIAIIRTVTMGAIALLISIVLAGLAGYLLAPLGNNYTWYSATTQLPFFISGILMFHCHARIPVGRQKTAVAALVSSTVVALAWGEAV